MGTQLAEDQANVLSRSSRSPRLTAHVKPANPSPSRPHHPLCRYLTGKKLSPPTCRCQPRASRADCFSLLMSRGCLLAKGVPGQNPRWGVGGGSHNDRDEDSWRTCARCSWRRSGRSWTDCFLKSLWSTNMIYIFHKHTWKGKFSLWCVKTRPQYAQHLRTWNAPHTPQKWNHSYENASEIYGKHEKSVSTSQQARTLWSRALGWSSNVSTLCIFLIKPSAASARPPLIQARNVAAGNKQSCVQVYRTRLWREEEKTMTLIWLKLFCFSC